MVCAKETLDFCEEVIVLWRLVLGNALMLFMLSWAVRLLLCWEPLLTCSACRAAPFRSKSSEGHICREGHSGPKCRQCAVSYFNRGGLCRGPRQFNPLHPQSQCKVLAPESMMRRLQCRGLPCTTNQLRSAAFGLAWGWGGVGLLILAVMTAAALLLLLHCQSLRATPTGTKACQSTHKPQPLGQQGRKKRSTSAIRRDLVEPPSVWNAVQPYVIREVLAAVQASRRNSSSRAVEQGQLKLPRSTSSLGFLTRFSRSPRRAANTHCWKCFSLT